MKKKKKSMSHCWDCALFPGLAWAVQEQDIASFLPWSCFTQCKLLCAWAGTQVEVTDFHVLVHSHGTCYLYQTPFSVFYKKQELSRGRHYCCSMWWFRRCSKPQLGKEMTPALTSSFTSPLREVAELWPAGAMLGAWLRLTGENQLLAEFAVF